VAKFKLDWAEMEERRRLVFEIHEEGRLTFEDANKSVGVYSHATVAAGRLTSA
jgi:hypothetical protein